MMTTRTTSLVSDHRRRGKPRFWMCFLCSLGLLIAHATAADARAATADPDRPNIVFVVADDLSYHSTGFMGDPIVRTPNLDALAKEGIVFTHAAVTTAICMVTRTNMLTGQYLAVLGAARVKPENWQYTWPATLRASGYYGGHIGKVHVNGQDASGYDFWAGRGGYAWLVDPKTGAKVHSLQRDTEEALRFLRGRPKDRPFFLQVAYTVPHAEDRDPQQYLPMPEEMGLYADVTIPVPPTAGDEYWHRLPAHLRDPANESRKRWTWRFDTPEKYQEYTKNYYRLISGMDRSIGTILAELRAQGLDQNTIIVFTGDNGYFLGEHGLADKWYGYEESVRVPLLIRDPRLPLDRRGQRNDDWVLNVDFAPTFCAFAGLRPPTVMQGRDLTPLLAGKRPADWRTDFLHQFKWGNEQQIPACENVCSKDWKYTRWIVSGAEELFDLRTDPRETRNLASDPAHAADLTRLRARLAALKTEVGGQPLEALQHLPFGVPRDERPRPRKTKAE